MPHQFLLFKRLALSMLLLTLCRAYFMLINSDLLSGLPASEAASVFFYGLLFDASSLTYLLLPFILLYIIPSPLRDKGWYRITGDVWYLLANTVMVLSNLADTHYFRFSGKRTGKEFLALEDDFTSMLGTYLRDYWFIIPIVLVFIVLLAWAYYRTGRHTLLNQKPRYKAELPVMVLLLGLFVIAARGGFYLKPIRTFDAARFVEPRLIPFTVNTPFQFISTIGGNSLKEVDYMPEQEAEKLIKPEQVFPGKEEKKNVVLIILESFGKEYMGHYNDGKGYTPFLDSLCKKSLVYDHAYANARKSIEGIPAILAGMPNLMEEPYINSIYQGNTLHSIGWYLQKDGFACSFFHGAKNGTMGLESFTNITGFGRYYGLDQYPEALRENDYDGNWGIFDEPYLQYVSQELGKQPEPFCSAVFTLSSHHPYTIPPAYESRFKSGTLPIHRSIRYADFALQRFFESASKQPWFRNTIFIITADHASENEQDYYNTSSGKYEIPLVIYRPDSLYNPQIQEEAKLVTRAQAGILPLALSSAGYQGPIFSLSWTGYRTNCPAVQLENGLYQLIAWPNVLLFDGKKTVGYYNIWADPLQKNNLAGKNDPMEQRGLELNERYLKAYLQVFSNRVSTNKFY